METIDVLYVDDKPDTYLARYLNESFESEKYSIKYGEIIFDENYNYQKLVNDSKLRQANVVFIDSMLFENDQHHEKFNGEEIKLLLRSFLPFIEVFVVTQNEIDDIQVVKKYNSSSSGDYVEYYNGIIPNLMDMAFEQVSEYERLLEKVKSNDAWDTFVKERVIGTFFGQDEYQELSKSDIDELVSAFKRLQESFYE